MDTRGKLTDTPFRNVCSVLATTGECYILDTGRVVLVNSPMLYAQSYQTIIPHLRLTYMGLITITIVPRRPSPTVQEESINLGSRPG